MALGKVPKIYIGWTVMIAGGILSFVIARNAVTRNRVEIMKSKQRIKNAVKHDQEEYAKALKTNS